MELSVRKLEYLQETKHLIRDAVNTRHQFIQETDTFRSYADKINAILNFKITNARYLFAESARLDLMDILLPSCEGLTDTTSMFYAYPKEDLALPSLDTSKVTSMDSMFRYSQNLVNLDISNFDMSSVTNMNWMFNNCSKLSNDSLNSILLLCTKAINMSSNNKKLYTIGFTKAQATICQTLSNYQAFKNAGWITGWDELDFESGAGND